MSTRQTQVNSAQPISLGLEMDIATVIGLVTTLGLIFYAMADAAGIGAFIEIN